MHHIHFFLMLAFIGHGLRNDLIVCVVEITTPRPPQLVYAYYGHYNNWCGRHLNTKSIELFQSNQVYPMRPFIFEESDNRDGGAHLCFLDGKINSEVVYVKVRNEDKNIQINKLTPVTTTVESIEELQREFQNRKAMIFNAAENNVLTPRYQVDHQALMSCVKNKSVEAGFVGGQGWKKPAGNVEYEIRDPFNPFHPNSTSEYVFPGQPLSLDVSECNGVISCARKGGYLPGSFFYARNQVSMNHEIQDYICYMTDYHYSDIAPITKDDHHQSVQFRKAVSTVEKFPSMSSLSEEFENNDGVLLDDRKIPRKYPKTRLDLSFRND